MVAFLKLREIFHPVSELKNNEVKTISSTSGPSVEALFVSPDGRSLLFTQFDEGGSDLMLVENFR